MANDGRVFIVIIHRFTQIQGILRGIDQVTNLVLEDVEERVFSKSNQMTVDTYDVNLFRGEDMCVISFVFDCVELLWHYMMKKRIKKWTGAKSVQNLLSPSIIALFSSNIKLNQP